MNVPNLLTTSRVFLGLIVAYMLLVDSMSFRIAAFFIFVVAALTDLFDGKISRKYNLITTYGKIMDPIADKVLTLGAFIAIYSLGVFPIWALVIIFLREIAVTITRLYLLAKGKAIAAEMAGKVKATFQFITLGFFYIYFMNITYLPDISEILTQILYYSSYALMYVVLILTIYSGSSFFKANWRYLR